MPLVDLIYSPVGDRLISLQPEGVVEVLDIFEDSLCFPAIREPDGVICFMDLSMDGNLLVTVTLRGTVSVWDANTGMRLSNPMGHPSRIFAARFCPDGSRLLTAGEDGQVRLWNWKDKILINPPFDHPDPVYDVAFLANGEWCLTACRDGAIRVWDCTHGGRMMPPLTVGTQAFEIRLDDEGSHAVFGSLSNEITLLSLHQFEDDHEEDAEYLRRFSEVVAGSEVSPDGHQRLDSETWLERFDALSSASPFPLETYQGDPIVYGEQANSSTQAGGADPFR
jgi:WD40 repeat protein